MSTSKLFNRYIDSYTIGELTTTELPKDITIDATDARKLELGYIQLPSGAWVHNSEAVMLPKGGNIVWTRR